MNFPDSSEAFRCVSQEGESGGTHGKCFVLQCYVL